MEYQEGATIQGTQRVAVTQEGSTVALPPPIVAETHRLATPPGLSAIQVPSEEPTPPNPVPIPEHPALVPMSVPTGARSETSPVGSPKGRPPVFHMNRTQQLIPGEDPEAEEYVEEGAPQTPAESEDVVMHDSVLPQVGQHPLATPIPPPASDEVVDTVASAPVMVTHAAPEALPSAPVMRSEDFYDRRQRNMYGERDFSLQPRLPAAYMFKLLGDKLAGVIMGCTDETKDECLNDEIFGLPEKHWDYLQHVKEGATFYLFNYTRRSLHGIFKSVEPAQWELKPSGWCPHPRMKTKFPAQIRVTRVDTYPCLYETEYKSILEWKRNYIENTSKFSFELDAEQVEAMNQLFENTKATQPNRQEPEIALRPQYDGYGMRDFRGPLRYPARGGRFAFGRGRGRAPPFRERGPPMSGRGMSSRGPPRGRGPPMGTTHPLARGRGIREARGPPPVAPRAAIPPPPRPAATPPPGMGAPSPSARSSAGLPVRPSSSPTPSTPVAASPAPPPPGL